MGTNKKNKGGAPKKAPEERQTRDLRCRVTESEQASIKEKAKEAGYSRTSDYIRDRVMGTAHPKAIITTPSKRFLASFFGFSTNLNQLMRHLHTYKAVMDEGSVKLLIQRNIELKNEVRRLREEILGEFDNETVMSIAINNLSLEDLDTVKEGIEGRMH